jgi:hypothetical protein
VRIKDVDDESSGFKVAAVAVLIRLLGMNFFDEGFAVVSIAEVAVKGGSGGIIADDNQVRDGDVAC